MEFAHTPTGALNCSTVYHTSRPKLWQAAVAISDQHGGPTLPANLDIWCKHGDIYLQKITSYNWRTCLSYHVWWDIRRSWYIYAYSMYMYFIYYLFLSCTPSNPLQIPIVLQPPLPFTLSTAFWQMATGSHFRSTIPVQTDVSPPRCSTKHSCESILKTEEQMHFTFQKNTLQGTNISHLGKRKIIFESAFWGDMSVPRRVNMKHK